MTPEQEEQVRRTLASLRSTKPMPPDVAARLDARIDQLRQERETAAGAAEGSTPRALGGAGPRRRGWPRMLVAAAVFTVVGIGVGTVLDDMTVSGGDAQSAGEAADSGGRALESAPDEEAAGQAPSAAATGKVAERMVLTEGRLDLDSRELAEDLGRFSRLRLPRAETGGEAQNGDAAATERLARLARLFSPCGVPPTRPGDRLVAVRLDTAPATLVLRQERGGARVAQIYSCVDPTRVLARTEVAAR